MFKAALLCDLGSISRAGELGPEPEKSKVQNPSGCEVSVFLSDFHSFSSACLDNEINRSFTPFCTASPWVSTKLMLIIQIFAEIINKWSTEQNSDDETINKPPKTEVTDVEQV